MVNSDDFIKRLEIILEYYNLSASSFADKVGVQRSSLSHLLSGRNKPSLDLIMKIVNEFPEVDLYWIINDQGNFPKSDKIIEEKNINPTIPENIKSVLSEEQPDLFTNKIEDEKNRVFENFENKISNTRFLKNSENDSEIEKIIILYKDGSFKTYNPKE